MRVLSSSSAASGAALVLLGVLAPSAAFAETFRVLADGTGQFGTIQEAIDAASDGDTVLVGPGTWEEALAVGDTTLTLEASDGAATTVIDGGGEGEAISVSGNAWITGFTLRNSGGHAISVDAGSPTLSDLVFEDLGTVDLYGGAVAVWTGSPMIMGCTFTGGSGLAGAHLFVHSGTVTVRDSDFSGGTASYGGSIAVGGGTLVLERVTVRGNVASVHGGGLYTAPGASLLLTDTTFSDNANSTGTPYGFGGGLFLGASGSLVAERVTFSGNGSPEYATAMSYGGGLFLDSSSSATLTEVTLDGNLAYYGGGLFQNDMATVDLVGSELRANEAVQGAAIWVAQGDQLSLADTSVLANTSLYSGAGIHVSSLTGLWITGTTFDGNLALDGNGAAAVVTTAGTLEVVDSSFDTNIAHSAGGALHLSDVDRVEFDRVSFIDNVATHGDGGAVYAVNSPSFTIVGSTFHENFASFGGGAISTGGGLDVSGTTFTNNEAELRSGGALSIDGEGAYAVRLTTNRFVQNTAGGDGGAVYLEGSGARVVRGNLLAGNRGDSGGGVYAGGPASRDEWTNNIIQENTARSGGGVFFVDTTSTALVNNVVVGNGASEAGAALYLDHAVVDVRNVVVAYNTGAAAVFASGDPLGLGFTYDAWYANSGGNLSGALDTTGLDATHRSDAPGFVLWSPNGDPTDDSFVLWRSSPLVDAGDPALQDEDGSTSDIGVYGGPHVALDDADGDGSYSAWDCDDSNAGVSPGAAETWYDGVDQDCSGTSDFDQDGDGQDSIAYGGEDCDDLRAAITGPCDTGGPDTGGDSGSDSGSDSGAEPGPDIDLPQCGCAVGGARAPGAVLFGLLMLGRRRSRS